MEGRRPRNFSDLFQPIIGPDGQPHGMIACDVAQAMESTAQLPTQAALDELLARATRVRFLGQRNEGRYRITDAPLIDTADPMAIAELRRCLHIVEGCDGHLLTHGANVLQVMVDDQAVAAISVIYGSILRWDASWCSDAHLSDPMTFLNWLAEQGLPELRADHLGRVAEAEQEAKHWDEVRTRWRLAMPACLLPFWDQGDWPDGSVPGKPADIERTLAETYPDQVDRAIQLLRWFGSGEGEWGSYPVWESIVEGMIDGLPRAACLAAAERLRDDPIGTEGVARHFVHAAHGEGLPAELRRRLLAHAEKSPIANNRARGVRAFADR